MERYLTGPLDYNSVWSFIRGADEGQLRMIERQTDYHSGLRQPPTWHAGRDTQGRCIGA